MAARTSMIRIAGVVLAIVVLAGCGVGQPGTSTTDLATPETSASPAPSADPAAPAPGDCPNFVEIVETGPMPGDDGTEYGPVAREQQRISGDVDAGVAYGAAHTDEFASVRFENGPRVRMVIGFTVHIEEHCAALRAILEYPDEFEIILQPETEKRLAEIQQGIVDLAGNRLRGVGIVAGTIDVQLRADGEAIADRIAATYGDLVSIQIGMLPYPDPFANGSGCGAMLGTIVTETPFTVTVTLADPTVQSGLDFRGTARVTNTSAETAHLDTGQPVSAIILRPGSNDVVGGYAGGIGGTGFGGDIEVGGHLDIELLGGTASCDPTLGYALPPGLYDARVLVDQYTMHENAPTEIAYLLSDPAQLTIVP